jgi:hypothetical protein
MLQHEHRSLAAALEPELRDACRGHLGEISWFTTTWAHSGAGTGFSTWTHNGSPPIECVVKLPVGYREYSWTKKLGLVHAADWERSASLTLPTPRVLAGGYELGGYDFAWIVMEKFKNPPIASSLDAHSLFEIFETCAEFHERALLLDIVDPALTPKDPDWRDEIERAIANVTEHHMDDADRWIRALERVRERLDVLVGRWAARDIDTWCHHDLHARNAMRRISHNPEVAPRVALIDLAMVAPGCWIEDALYLERLFWGHEEALCAVDPVRELARCRASLGLPDDDASIALADVKRVLEAARCPNFLKTESDQKYLAAALSRLESLLEPATTGNLV